jgi:tetratricopeptide (TPR) repeat protein/mono/diheme cytochrome c family protein
VIGLPQPCGRRTIVSRRVRAAAIVIVFSAMGGAAAWNMAPPTSAARRQTDPLTFTRDIAPILFDDCAACHRPGGVGPFSVLTYQDVRPRARQIVTETTSRSMPPWKPEPGYGEFSGVRRLSDDAIARIQRWVEEGAIEGDPSDLPPLPTWPDGWQLGVPDLVVRMLEPFVVPAEGEDIYRNFSMAIPVAEAQYVRAVEFRPGNGGVVHHARIMMDRTGMSRKLEAEDRDPGYDGMLLDGAEFPDGHFLGWAAGKMPSVSPEDLAWSLEPGTDLVLQTHLLPNGRQEAFQGSFGFFFSDTPPTRAPVVLVLDSRTIDIPAGEREHVVEATYTLPVDVDALRVSPHAHYLGKDMQAFARLPNGTTMPLIHVPDWDFDWQDDYEFAAPVHLPKGTTLVMRYVYDNSAENARNPSTPPRRVVFGPRSSDEMAQLMLQVLPSDPADRAALRQDFANAAVQVEIAGYEKMIRDDPGDYESRNALALRHYGLGREEDALRQFEEAVRLNPDFGDGQYSFGTVLARLGRLEEAAAHLARAVEIEPDRVEAHNNLGGVLHSLGRFATAAAHYRWAAQLDPDDVGARRNLGVVLRSMGQLDEAISMYRQALERSPDDVETHSALGVALAELGRPDDAISEFLLVLEGRPDDQGAHYNLAVVLVSQRRTADALGHFRQALQIRPDWPAPLSGLAWVLATYPDSRVRDPLEAVSLAERAAELTGRREIHPLDVLAAAYAAAGRFRQAVETARAAVDRAVALDQVELATQIRRRLELYLQNRPYLQPF